MGFNRFREFLYEYSGLKVYEEYSKLQKEMPYGILYEFAPKQVKKHRTKDTIERDSKTFEIITIPCTLNLTLDVYAKTRKEAEEKANTLYNFIFIVHEYDLRRYGFGHAKGLSEVKNKTGTEENITIFRYGFDLTINCEEITEREVIPIENIEFSVNNEKEKVIGGNNE